MTEAEAPERVALGVLLLIDPTRPGLSINGGTDERAAGVDSQPEAQSQPNRDIAAVLRRTFQATIDETVPDEMLDLLSKLS